MAGNIAGHPACAEHLPRQLGNTEAQSTIWPHACSGRKPVRSVAAVDHAEPRSSPDRTTVATPFPRSAGRWKPPPGRFHIESCRCSADRTLPSSMRGPSLPRCKIKRISNGASALGVRTSRPTAERVAAANSCSAASAGLDHRSTDPSVAVDVPACDGQETPPSVSPAVTIEDGATLPVPDRGVPCDTRGDDVSR